MTQIDDGRPDWYAEPFAVYAAVVAAGCRVARFRLTAQQANELETWVGRRDLLLGCPVVIR